MDSYTIIEDVFGDEDNSGNSGRNQITAARGYVGRSHVPEDMRTPSRQKVGRVSERPDMPDVEDIRRSIGPQQNQNIQFQDQIDPSHMNLSQTGMMNQGPVLYPGVDTLQCRDVFTHVENCPICSSYFKKDVKFYWLIIGILIIVILILTRNGK